METQILLHNIKYAYFYYDLELPESEEEHIEQMIRDGFRCGELNHYDIDKGDNRGWWEIV